VDGALVHVRALTQRTIHYSDIQRLETKATERRKVRQTHVDRPRPENSFNRSWLKGRVIYLCSPFFASKLGGND